MEVVRTSPFQGNIAFVKEEFTLNEKEAQHLTKTIKGYSGEKSFQHFLYRLKNVIKSIFMRSDWQIAKRDLNHMALNVLQRRSGHSITDKTKVKQLSEFVLRYLVTTYSPEKPKYYIPQKKWDSDLFRQAVLGGKVSEEALDGKLTEETFDGKLTEKTFTNMIVGDLYVDAPQTEAACLELVSERLKKSTEFFRDHLDEIVNPLKKVLVQSTIDQLKQNEGLLLKEAFRYANNFSGVDLQSKVSKS